MDILALGSITCNPTNGVCLAGTTNTWNNSVAINPVIKGKYGVTLATNSNQSKTPTLDANTGVAFTTILPNKCAAIVFGVNAAGTIVGAQGPIIDTVTGVTTTVGAFIGAPQFPAIPDDFCPIAYTVVRVAPSGTTGFTCGVTEWAASSMSCTTFQNVFVLPSRPQIA